ncbi:MAG TPA: DUF3299 domain-containing protein [Acidobacteriaceae bacterium]|nr:DUF3299 domain-containing protein [Acidobacteriaceae bacterium]
MRNKADMRRAKLGILAWVLVLGSSAPLWAAPPPVTVNWQILQTLDFTVPQEKQKTAALQLAGKRVSIPGFMVPLEDDLEQVTEFLLVPYAGACIHVPPPPPNQIVYVKMDKSTKVQVTFTDPILVTGTLKISTVESPYGAVSYDLSGETVVPYQQ